MGKTDDVAALVKDVIPINPALSVDLQGQVRAESIVWEHYAGTGEQPAFVRGAYYRSSRGQAPFGNTKNKSFIVLQSIYQDNDGTVHSRMFPPFGREKSSQLPEVMSHIVPLNMVSHI
ncbi:MAG TPA: hypothetical protein ENO00_08495 [Deltaproteobacteria bacterium]|nr:hypothetical protein [Deltaproteobacteria bacterium]